MNVAVLVGGKSLMCDLQFIRARLQTRKNIHAHAGRFRFQDGFRRLAGQRYLGAWDSLLLWIGYSSTKSSGKTLCCGATDDKQQRNKKENCSSSYPRKLHHSHSVSKIPNLLTSKKD